ncbi:hypothetical protein [Planctomycetes bacterium TBK1r]|uniref:Uncharacterized protein n=1 Tax=Stieleria magnilauensis TaxID=2527963 RepID=A0ABX5XUW0_9BACT|nr:hypothetical protein TBK1r_48300 [Planctomycetes bacterium TBK1r]
MLRTFTALSLAATFAVSTLSAQATGTPPVTKAAVATKKTDPVYPANPPVRGLAEVEEFLLLPLHKEPHFVLKATGEALRSKDDKRAVQEILRAITWLRVIESHATPEGKKNLSDAIEQLAKIETDLGENKTVEAAAAAKAIGSAYYAIANDHYLKAKQDHTGTAADMDSNMGAKHLIAAGLYLQEAARSANTDLSNDVQDSLTSLIGFKHPESDAEAAKYGNVLAMHLKQVGDGLQQLGAELQQP